MKKELFIDQLRFALSQVTTWERLRYIVLSLVFFPLLARAMSADTMRGHSTTSSEAGDDIYPLF